jgi:hypothetical protein
MKSVVFSIIILTVLISCDGNKEGKPALWFDYIEFVTDEEADLFISYPEYDIDEVVLYDAIHRSLDLAVRFVFIDTVDGIHRLGWPGHLWKEEIYIDYGNGDIDTLTLDWEPQDVAVEDVFLYKGRKFEAVDNVTISFNGTPVVLWDFIANPGLKNEIPSRNSLQARDRSDFDPVVITLPKEPDWDELN